MDYSGLAIGMALSSIPVSAAAFVACLSAASATIIVTTLALANMCLNHLVLPFRPLQIDRAQGIYTQLKWLRRSLIADSHSGRVSLFCDSQWQAEPHPTGAGGIYRHPAIPAGHHRHPLLVHRPTAMACWLGWAVDWESGSSPCCCPWPVAKTPICSLHFIGMLLGQSDKLWTSATLVSLGLNAGLFIVISLLTRTSTEEKVAAEICSMDDLARPTRHILSVYSAADFSQRLAPALGEQTAASEVERALSELQFSADGNQALRAAAPARAY